MNTSRKNNYSSNSGYYYSNNGISYCFNNNSSNSNNSNNNSGRGKKTRAGMIAVLLVVAMTAGILAGCAADLNINTAGTIASVDNTDAGYTGNSDATDKDDEDKSKVVADSLFADDEWEGLDETVADKADDEWVGLDETVADKADGEWVGLDDAGTEGSSDNEKISDSKADEGNVSSSETADIERDINSVMYNGFIVEEFDSPDTIPWNQVFYLGAYIKTDEFSDIESELDKIYSQDVGWDVTEYGGVDIYKAADVKEFVKATSGLDIDEVTLPSSMIYYKKWDIYVKEAATDTNELDVEVTSVTLKDGIYTVDYISKDVTMQLKMKKNGQYWQFISNLWNPKQGREAGISKLYDEVLQKYYAGISNSWGLEKCKENKINDIITYYARSDAPLKEAGYLEYDLDGDGTNELLIGEITGGDKSDFIFDAYTAKRGECNRIYDIASYAGERDRFYIAKDNTIYEEASGGASESKIMHYNINSTFTYVDLLTIDGVIYSEDGEAGRDNPYYSCGESGYFNKAKWEQITKAEYNDYANKAQASYLDLELIPFSALEDA